MTLTIEECVYFLTIASAVGNHVGNESSAVAVVERDLNELLADEAYCLEYAGERTREQREFKVAALLCRQAIEAIVRERGG